MTKKVDRDYDFYKREFLNLPAHQSHAHLLLGIDKLEVENLKSGKYCSGVVGSIAIADCTRTIELDISYPAEIAFDDDLVHDLNEEYRKNALYKLDFLVDSLIEFRKRFKQQAKKVDKELPRRKKECRAQLKKLKKQLEEQEESK